MNTNGKGEDYLATLREMARDRSRLEAQIAEMAGALRGKRKALATLLQAEQRYLYEITGIVPLPLYDAAEPAPPEPPLCCRCQIGGSEVDLLHQADEDTDLIPCDLIDCEILTAIGLPSSGSEKYRLCAKCLREMTALQAKPRRRATKASASPEPATAVPRTLTPEPIAGLGVTPEQLDTAYVTAELVGGPRERSEPAKVKAFTFEPGGRRWINVAGCLQEGGARTWDVLPLCSAERFANDYPGIATRLVPGNPPDAMLGVLVKVGRQTLIIAGERERRRLIQMPTQDEEPIGRNTLLNEVAALSLPDTDALDHAGLRTVGDLLERAAKLGLRVDAEGRPYRDDTQHVYTVLKQTKRLSREGALAIGDAIVESELISREDVCP